MLKLLTIFNKILMQKNILKIFKNCIFRLIPDSIYIIYSRFKSTHTIPNLIFPKLFSEKILWLKLHDRRDWHREYADKITSKKIIKRLVGDEFVVPTIKIFKDIYDFKKNIDKFKTPYIIKLNHDSGGGYIIRNKKELMTDEISSLICERMTKNHYTYTKEFQYKEIKPKIFLEHLLLDKSGKIPNDYKCHVLNNKVEFIYCSIDMETKNYRKIYLPDWSSENMLWAPKGRHQKKFSGSEIPKPQNLDIMISLSEKLSKGFAYIRIDFYEIDGQVYVGEFTQHQGSGNEVILPKYLDKKYGRILNHRISNKSKPY